MPYSLDKWRDMVSRTATLIRLRTTAVLSENLYQEMLGYARGRALRSKLTYFTVFPGHPVLACNTIASDVWECLYGPIAIMTLRTIYHLPHIFVRLQQSLRMHPDHHWNYVWNMDRQCRSMQPKLRMTIHAMLRDHLPCPRTATDFSATATEYYIWQTKITDLRPGAQGPETQGMTELRDSLCMYKY